MSTNRRDKIDEDFATIIHNQAMCKSPTALIIKRKRYASLCAHMVWICVDRYMCTDTSMSAYYLPWFHLV